MSDVLALNQETTQVLEAISPSLVQVRNGKRGAGAGTIWHPQGLIVTNAHVVGHGPVKVELADGTVLPADILASDPERDLAALRVDVTGLPTIGLPTIGLPTIGLGDSRAVRAGQWVLALGHPWGVTGAATAGVVIGSGREWPEMPAMRRDWIVVSLHMRPGHSGGPLIDVQGRLLGINTMITGPDVGFAIPVHVVVGFLKDRLLK